MNKLNVAIKLLQLLNDRKFIDTKIVANELNVSLRTAQRYLLELSTLPCVLFDDKNRSYSLDATNKMNKVLLNGADKKTDSGNGLNMNEIPVGGINKKSSANNALNMNINSFNKMMCLICRNNRMSFSKAPPSCQNNSILSNNHVMNKIVSIIKKSCVY